METLLTAPAMSAEVWQVAALGLGGAFVVSLAVLLILLWRSQIDHGLLGLIFLLIVVVFIVAFSFLVAAATPGISFKIAVTVFNGLLAVASKLLSDRFLTYLES